jgi:hypothetical protein
MGNSRVTEFNESIAVELEQIDYLRHDPVIMLEISSLEESAKAELALSRTKGFVRESNASE